MPLTADVRNATHERPYLLTAFRTGIVNYAIAAAELDLGGDEVVAAASRRFAASLPPFEANPRDAVMMMRGGVGLVGEDVEVAGGEPVLPITGVDLAGGGPLTAITAKGEVDPTILIAVLSRLDAESVVADVAGVMSGALVVIVSRRQGAVAFRVAEATVSDLYV